MRENMKYDTNQYQLRESILKRMLQIIAGHKYIEPHGIVFYGDSITEINSINIDKNITHDSVQPCFNIGTNIVLVFVSQCPEQSFLI